MAMTTPAAQVQPFFHEPTSTWSYVVADPATRRAAIIDPALDFDLKSGRCAADAAQKIVDHVQGNELTVDWILETHAHADHLSAAPWLQDVLGGKIAIGENIREVQKTFARVYNLTRTLATDGSQFDRLFRHEEKFALGSLEARVIATPGHTNDSVSYLIGDALFTGDTIFMPDGGSARCDFPGGDARRLYASIQRLFALPPETRMFVCHDYGPGGREVRCETTVAEQMQANIHVRTDLGEEEFVKMREARDATLDLPALLYPAVQVNINGGRLLPAEDNGRYYLKLPIFPAKPGKA